MDINFPININSFNRFNEIRNHYEEKVVEFSFEMVRSKRDAERVNEYLKNQVKKINLLKSTGIKTSVNKYILNMKYLGVKYEEKFSVREDILNEVTVQLVSYKSFEEFITFDRKNIIQKAASMVFRAKVIDDKILEWKHQNEDIIIKNQVLILDRYNLLENLYNRRLRLRGVLEEISKIENEFNLNKEEIKQAIWDNYKPEEKPVLNILEKYKELIRKITNEEY